MRIAVASGKGGTGKTTVATSLALAAPDSQHTLLLDCDVEAPNAHLFVGPTLEREQDVGILIPEVDMDLCTGCGRCAQVCEFHAIAVISGQTLVFPELCHGCGSCTLVCPEKAISERLDVMGALQGGPAAQGLTFARGLMNVGEPMATPIIRQLKSWSWFATKTAWETVIIDAPPGTACPVVESVSGADFALLVTEPTPFGLHDLRLMVEVVRELDIPAGVVINRDGIGDDGVDRFCAQADLPILLRIPLDREIGAGLAQGRPLLEIRPDYVAPFQALRRDIEAIARGRSRHG